MSADPKAVAAEWEYEGLCTECEADIDDDDRCHDPETPEESVCAECYLARVESERDSLAAERDALRAEVEASEAQHDAFSLWMALPKDCEETEYDLRAAWDRLLAALETGRSLRAQRKAAGKCACQRHADAQGPK